MARKLYTQEFKEQAVKLSYSNGKKMAETAADLGLPVNMLHRWRRESKREGRAFPGHGKARDEEVADLKKRLRQAELERDILKKAVSFFSQLPK
jgi:transposase